ncbi:MAG TPA: HDIG domain-containing protein [Candidatus Kapabacteria bacterium]|nr:HDIG domain-containing protein [Candidatus Kapabacteria bacterium]
MSLSQILNAVFNFRARGKSFDNTKFRSSLQIKILILLISILICSFFITVHFDTSHLKIDKSSLQVGTPWKNQTLVADQTFPIYKNYDEYQKLVSEAQSKVLPVFVLNESNQQNLIASINNFLSSLELTDSLDQTQGNSLFNQRLLLVFLENPKPKRIEEINKARKIIIPFINKLYSKGFVDISLQQIKATEIKVMLNSNEFYYKKTLELLSQNDIKKQIDELLQNNFTKNSVPLLTDFLQKNIKPNYLYSSDLTNKEIELAKQNVPLYDGYIKSGQIIVQKGQIITREIQQQIESYREAKKLVAENYLTSTYVLGNIGVSLIIFLIPLVYFSILRKKIFADNIQILIFYSSLILGALLSWLSVEIPSEFPLGLLVPLPAISMLIAIVFDSRTAFYATIASSLLLAVTRGGDLTTAISFIFVGVLAAFTVRDIQSRTQMYRSIFYVFIGLLFSIIVFDLQSSSTMAITFQKVIAAFINSNLSPLLTFALVLLIENTTSITTDLRIKEYDNPNHPLLKKMSEVAPGTYQHTLNVAILAERCAIDIEANPLLTRVGAYFHDIGKIPKPEYFIENQSNIENKLEFLSPKKAAEIIRQHVSDGIEIGKEYKLPQKIIDFIPMHHGTSLIQHFYAKALEDTFSKEDIDENDFRYPGPKPNSKETAILMICDMSEAISKIKDISNEEIKKMVHNGIQNKINDGQFNDTNLTFSDITKIEDTIVKTLLGVTQRTKYKEIPNSKNL